MKKQDQAHNQHSDTSTGEQSEIRRRQSIQTSQNPWIELENSVAQASALIDLMSEQLGKLYQEEGWDTDDKESLARTKGFGVWHLREYVNLSLWRAFNAAHVETVSQKQKGNRP